MKSTHFSRHTSIRRRHVARGFTLIEIMVVVVILGILAAIVAPNVMRRIDDAQLTKVASDIRTIETALNLYRMDNFRYPTTEQGIKALYEKPNDSSVRNWKPGGYLDPTARKDPWGNDYRYVYPGTHGKEFDLFTYGADNQEGGEGLDADIGNWVQDKQ
ncbi:type II secretion system major pseudopilin GspG [Steroidobacter sp. S1-65]|uniref:Type II secretion system core protein G n=1 Tax=Steroidobacter gossypii TaxID=2805490 RepID=A0ABS1X269_9GAMM|nr:type II secretion system major pseudopilin GspG [Steroidobacter gossypii]MBM0107330.1 type II secretion system major pseudopilin GspG [Steroidobacter gossypii]